MCSSDLGDGYIFNSETGNPLRLREGAGIHLESGDVQVNEDLDVQGSLLDSTGRLTLGDSVEVTGDLYLGSKVFDSSTGRTQLLGNFDISKDLTVSDDITVGDLGSFKRLEVSGGVTANAIGKYIRVRNTHNYGRTRLFTATCPDNSIVISCSAWNGSTRRVYGISTQEAYGDQCQSLWDLGTTAYVTGTGQTTAICLKPSESSSSLLEVEVSH